MNILTFYREFYIKRLNWPIICEEQACSCWMWRHRLAVRLLVCIPSWPLLIGWLARRPSLLPGRRSCCELVCLTGERLQREHGNVDLGGAWASAERIGDEFARRGLLRPGRGAPGGGPAGGPNGLRGESLQHDLHVRIPGVPRECSSSCSPHLDSYNWPNICPPVNAPRLLPWWGTGVITGATKLVPIIWKKPD